MKGKTIMYLILGMILMIGVVDVVVADFRDNYINNYIITYLDTVYTYQNLDENSFFYGSFDYGYWNNNISNTVSARYNEWIYPGAILYSKNYTSLMKEQTYLNQTLLNKVIRGFDFYVFSQGTKGGWITVNTKSNINYFEDNQYDATTFGLYALTETYNLISNNLTGIYENYTFTKNVADSDFLTKNNYFWGDDNGRWGESIDGYRITNSTNFVYFHFYVPNKTALIDRNQDDYLDLNISISITYNDTILTNITLAIKNQSGPAPNAFYDLDKIIGINDSLIKTQNFIIPMEKGLFSHTNEDLIFYLSSNPSGTRIYNISMNINRNDSWILTMKEAGHMLINTYNWTKDGTLTNDEENNNYWFNDGCKKAINQMSKTSVGLLLLYNITQNTTYLDGSNKALSCIFNINSEYLNREPNLGFLWDSGFNENSTSASGLDIGYNSLLLGGLSKYYQLTKNKTVRSYLDNSFNITQRFLIPKGESGLIDVISNPSTRTDITYPQYYYNEEGYFIYSLFTISSFNKYAQKVLYLIQQNESLTNYSMTSTFQRIYTAGLVLDSYSIWNEPTNTINLSNELDSGYLLELNKTGVIVSKTKNYLITIGINNVTPSGGGIGQLYNLKTNSNLLSGNPYEQDGKMNYNSSDKYLPGMTLLTPTENDKRCSSGFDFSTTHKIVSSIYPLMVSFSGEFKHINQTSCGVTYNTNYTFYNNSIYIEQETSSETELQLWGVSLESIGEGVIRGIDLTNGNTFNNITFIPINFDLYYNDSGEVATWGTVDKFNASGTNFKYIIQMNESGEFYTKNGDEISINNINKLMTLSFYNLTTGHTLKSKTKGTYIFTSTTQNKGDYNYTMDASEEIEVRDYGCTVPMDGMEITANTVFCGGEYSLNGSNGDYAILINSSDVYLDCNNSLIYGNETLNIDGLMLDLGENITITNCNISNYYNGLTRGATQQPQKNNVTIINNWFYDLLYFGINIDNLDNSIIKHNVFENINYTSIRLHSTDNVTVQNNTINNTIYSFAGIFLDGRTNKLDNNTIYVSHDNNVALRLEQDGSFDNSDNHLINNRIYGNGSGYGYYATEFNFNNNISNNIFSNLKWGITSLYNDTQVTNNIINNTIYGMVISTLDSNNVIENNYIGYSNVGSRVNKGTDNMFITNTFDNINTYNLLLSGSGINSFRENVFTENKPQFITSSSGTTINFMNITTGHTLKSKTKGTYIFTSTTQNKGDYNYTMDASEEIEVKDYGCTVPMDGMEITANTVFCGGEYSLNGSSSGAIIINDNNIELDCNGSLLYGNYSQDTSNSNSRGIGISTKHNISIKNCIIQDYYWGIVTLGGNNLNHTYTNLNISDLKYGVGLNSINNSLIENNNFNNVSRSVYLFNSNHNIITRNNLDNITTYGVEFSTNSNFNNLSFNYITDSSNYCYGVMLFNTAKGNIISNNYLDRLYYGMTIKGNDTLIKENNLTNFIGEGIRIDGTTNNTNITLNNFINSGADNFIDCASNCLVENNYLYNHTSYQPIRISDGSDGAIIRNNIIDLNSKGIYISNASNFIIEQNIINNTILNYDGWNTGIYIEDVNKTHIINYPHNGIVKDNVIENYGCVGLLIRGADNISIENNTINQASINFYISNGLRCSNEPQAGIFINEVYKGYIPIGTSASDNYNITSIHKSSNVTLINNTFNSNVKIKLRTQGTIDLVSDISNYWIVSWRLPYLLDIDNYYISDTHNNISTINSNSQYTENLWQGINNNRTINYSISKSSYHFKNIHVTTKEINLFNLTSARILYNDNSEERCDGDCNVTLSPNEYIYVYDNHNYVTPPQGGGLPTQTTRISRTVTIPSNESLVELNISDATSPINDTCPDGQIGVLIDNELKCFECDGEIVVIGGNPFCKTQLEVGHPFNLQNLNFKVLAFISAVIIAIYVLLNTKKIKRKK